MPTMLYERHCSLADPKLRGDLALSTGHRSDSSDLGLREFGHRMRSPDLCGRINSAPLATHIGRVVLNGSLEQVSRIAATGVVAAVAAEWLWPMPMLDKEGNPMRITHAPRHLEPAIPMVALHALPWMARIGPVAGVDPG
jgi:hypothetical protein